MLNTTVHTVVNYVDWFLFTVLVSLWKRIEFWCRRVLKLIYSEQYKIELFGEAHSGRTSILSSLTLGSIVNVRADYRSRLQSVEYADVKISKNELVLDTWNTKYVKASCKNCHGLIFVIDSSLIRFRPNHDMSNRPYTAEDFHASHISTNRDTLHLFASWMKPHVPLLILFNKKDMRNNRLTLDILKELYKIDELPRRASTVFCQETDAKTGKGIYESLEWLFEKTVVNSSNHW